MDIPTDTFVTDPSPTDPSIEPNDGLNPLKPEFFSMGGEADAAALDPEIMDTEPVAAIDPLIFTTYQIAAISTMVVPERLHFVDVETLPPSGEPGGVDVEDQATVGGPALAEGDPPDQFLVDGLPVDEVLTDSSGGDGRIAAEGWPDFIAWSTVPPGLESGESEPEPLTDPAIGELATDDLVADAGTTANLTIAESDFGATSYGTIETAGDHDWFGISLVAGQTYKVTVFADSLEDPTLSLRDGTGAELLFCDDADGLEPEIVFTAETTGTHFLDVGAYDETVGDYGVSFTLLPDGLPPAPEVKPWEGEGTEEDMEPPTGIWVRGETLTMDSGALVRPFSPLACMRGVTAPPENLRGSTAVEGTELSKGPEVVSEPPAAGMAEAISLQPPFAQPSIDPITGSPTQAQAQPIVGVQRSAEAGGNLAVDPSLQATPAPCWSSSPWGSGFSFTQESSALLAAPRRQGSGEVPTTSWSATAEGTAPATTSALISSLVGFGSSVRDPLVMGWGIESLMPPLIVDLVPDLLMI